MNRVIYLKTCEKVISAQKFQSGEIKRESFNPEGNLSLMSDVVSGKV